MSLAALATAALAASWLLAPVQLSATDLYYAVFLAVLIGVANGFPFQMSLAKMTVGTAPALAAALLLTPPVAITACVLAKGLGQFSRDGLFLQKT